MPDKPPSERSLALIALRHRRGWTQERLAEVLGIKGKSVSQYENGYREPSVRVLLRFSAAMGYCQEEVDCLLFGTTAVCDPNAGELSPAENRLIRQEAARAGLARVKATSTSLYAAAQRARRKVEREEASPLAYQLLRLGGERPATGRSARRRDALVAEIPDHLAWAVVERLTSESLKATAADPHQAVAFTALSCRLADRDRSGKESWSKLQGKALVFHANALRVVGDHAGSEEAFSKARKLLKGKGSAGGGPGLPPWRLLDMQASLRRDQRRWKEALALLDSALALAPRGVQGRILLKKAAALHEMGVPEQAVETLYEATPMVDGSSEPRLPWVLRFNLVMGLIEVGRAAEAASLLPEATEMALELGNAIDALRCSWASGRISSALGRREEAISILGQVRKNFADREMPYDCALVALEEAGLRLEAGEHLEAADLSREILWIFRVRAVEPEALAALRLFCDSALSFQATSELARQLYEQVSRARERFSSPDKELAGGE